MSKRTPKHIANAAMTAALSYPGVWHNGKADVSQIPGYQMNRLIDALTACRDHMLAELAEMYSGYGGTQ